MNRFKWKGGLIWFAAIVLIGLGMGFTIQTMINQYTDLVTVYVAKQDLPVDRPVQADQLVKKQLPKAAVPDTAVTDPAKVDGLYANTTILQGQIVEQRALSDARTLREVIRKYGMNYGALTIPVDQNDFPVESVQVGDTVNLIGIFGNNGPNGTVLTSQYVAENVPVLNVLTDTKSGTPKLVVAVTREDGLKVARDLSAGKIRVMLDPRPFTPTVKNSTAEGDVKPLETTIQSAKREKPSLSPQIGEPK